MLLFSSEQTPESWSLVFRIAAGVHLFGISFYAIFASGELQYWAEPVVEEKKVWSPTTAGQLKETTFVRHANINKNVSNPTRSLILFVDRTATGNTNQFRCTGSQLRCRRACVQQSVRVFRRHNCRGTGSAARHQRERSDGTSKY